MRGRSQRCSRTNMLPSASAESRFNQEETVEAEEGQEVKEEPPPSSPCASADEDEFPSSSYFPPGHKCFPPDLIPLLISTSLHVSVSCRVAWCFTT